MLHGVLAATTGLAAIFAICGSALGCEVLCCDTQPTEVIQEICRGKILPNRTKFHISMLLNSHGVGTGVTLTEHDFRSWNMITKISAILRAVCKT